MRSEAQIIESIRVNAVMATRAGRAYIWSLLSNTIYVSAYSPEPTSMAFNVGQQNVGLKIEADIKIHCPEQYLLMLKEAKEDQDNDRRNAEQSSTSTES